MMENKEERDFEFMIRLLPNYFITCDQKPGKEIWRCRSNSGISDAEKFEYIVKAIKHRWPGRYISVEHQTYHNNVDFSIHLRNERAWDGPLETAKNKL